MITADLVGWESIIPNIDKVRFKYLSSDGKYLIIQALEKCNDYSKLFFLETNKNKQQEQQLATPIELNIFSGYNDMIALMGGIMGGDGIFYCGMWNDIEAEISILCIDLEKTKSVISILNVPLGHTATHPINRSYKPFFGTFEGTTDIHGNVYLLLKGTSLILFIDIQNNKTVDIIHYPTTTTANHDQPRGTYFDIVCLKWNHNGNSYVYCIPDRATKVLCINSIDQSTFYLPLDLEPEITSRKYSGYCVGNQGTTIYCIPFNSRKVLCIEENFNNTNYNQDMNQIMSPSTKCIQIYYLLNNKPSGYIMAFENKWSCGIHDRGDSIYCLPYHHTHILQICTKNKSIGCVEIKTEGWQKQTRLTGTGGYWNSGILGRDGAIYGLPYYARHVLRIDTHLRKGYLIHGQQWDENTSSSTPPQDSVPPHIMNNALRCEYSYAPRHGSIIAFNRLDDDDHIRITYPDIWGCFMLLYELCKQKRAQVISSSFDDETTNQTKLLHWLFCELGEEYLFRTIVSFV